MSKGQQHGLLISEKKFEALTQHNLKKKKPEKSCSKYVTNAPHMSHGEHQ